MRDRALAETDLVTLTGTAMAPPQVMPLPLPGDLASWASGHGGPRRLAPSSLPDVLDAEAEVASGLSTPPSARNAASWSACSEKSPRERRRKRERGGGMRSREGENEERKENDKKSERHCGKVGRGREE